MRTPGKHNEAEYLEYRCCMCPNIGTANTVCPAGMWKGETPCRFVKAYTDSRKATYFVRGSIGADCYKTFVLKPLKSSSHGFRALPWRDSFDEAQADLNRYAKKHAWSEHSLQKNNRPQKY